MPVKPKDLGADQFASVHAHSLTAAMPASPQPASIHRPRPPAYIQRAFLGHASCTLMGLSSSQNAAASFFRVVSESIKLPRRLSSSSTAGRGRAGTPGLWPPVQLSTGQPRPCQPTQGCLWGQLKVDGAEEACISSVP